MRLRNMTLAVAACALVGATASDVFAQTQQLNKTLERKFPEGLCPIDTNFLGSFVTNTGIIQLTFVTRGDDDGSDLKTGDVAVAFGQILDDISIIEASEFNDPNNQEEHENCYFDVRVPFFKGNVTGNPKVPFHDSFGPSTSPCPWDETNGVQILSDALQFTGAGATGEFLSTSVVISGLTPGTPYVLYGNWTAFGFNLPDDCLPPSCCLQVTIDDVQAGCGTLPVQKTTWGQVKALYKN